MHVAVPETGVFGIGFDANLTEAINAGYEYAKYSFEQSSLKTDIDRYLIPIQESWTLIMILSCIVIIILAINAVWLLYKCQQFCKTCGFIMCKSLIILSAAFFFVIYL